MNGYETLHSAEDFKYKNLILSIAGAVLLSAIGFGLIFLLPAWLIPRWMIWEVNHPHNSAIIPVFLTSVFSLSAIILGARRRRCIQKKPPSPKQTILPF
jgi:O-antigen/teichoic acid export membrane protein